MIRYKAERLRIHVLDGIDEAYSSQTCHACGEVDREGNEWRSRMMCGLLVQKSEAHGLASEMIPRKSDP